MKCPHDQTLLKRKQIKRTKLDGYFCSKCGGMWIPYKTVSTLFKNSYLKVPSEVYSNLEPIVKSEKWITEIECPEDGSLFNTYLYMNIQIDICNVCKGLWLDKSELEKLWNKQAFFSEFLVSFCDLIRYT